MSKARAPKVEPQAVRSNRARAVGDMLPSVGGTCFRRFGFVQHTVVSRWPEIVGDRFARVSTPESIRFPAGKKAEGTLCVAVEGAHAPMFQHVAPAIVERVNRFFGYSAVAKVAIRQGAAAPRPAPPSLRPVQLALSDEVGGSVRDVADPELRACLAALGAAVEASAAPARAAAIPVLGRVR
ncbi:DUF721 domain-containing protein [Sphingomonas jatrophae]|uniref:DUF721 domain-containing protein n=1 Tax=Sphingomonas jatrophae TaxID=1166337 RepID=A0A1I6KYX1_9SPHN|nr:DciA family protein [Sphingomonas jatrophae]SFR96120.1 Protein of unknown function [Sphingomonas jatrophae]